jgi:hypothetical protein
LSGVQRRRKFGRVCYALKSVYSFLKAEVIGMSASERDGLGGKTVEEVITNSGVKITPQEAEAVARSLARIHAAASILQRSRSFDDSGEQYYRLLDRNAAGETGT